MEIVATVSTFLCPKIQGGDSYVCFTTNLLVTTKYNSVTSSHEDASSVFFYFLSKGGYIMSNYYDERIAKLKEKREQLYAQERELKKRQTQAERKKRNHRFMQIGGIVEMVLKRKLTDEDIKKFERFLIQQENNGKYFSTAMNKTSNL